MNKNVCSTGPKRWLLTGNRAARSSWPETPPRWPPFLRPYSLTLKFTLAPRLLNVFPQHSTYSCGAVSSTLLTLPLPPHRLAWPLLLPLVVPPHPSFPPTFHPSLQNDALTRLSLMHASHADAFTFSLSPSTRFLLPTNGTARRRKSRPS
jgi:hypothetical protein